jgi:4-hydroxybenzoate polyprenyltransferase
MLLTSISMKNLHILFLLVFRALAFALGAQAWITPYFRPIVSTRALNFVNKPTQWPTRHVLLAQRQDPEHNNNNVKKTTFSIFQDYLSLLRPVTLIQAVGAWVVGRLLMAQPPNFGQPQEWLAMVCVYLTYGVGMVANDCADAALDKGGEETKRQRAIASGRVSVKQGWIFVALLTTISLGTAFRVSPQFGGWCASCVALMLLYAGGLQNILLIKNVLVGWLCIAPLWGAATLNDAPSLTNALFQTKKMTLLAATGFSLGVIREILKDIQDVELDRGTKFTLPMWIGATAAQHVSFVALGVTLLLLQTPLYRGMFAASSSGVPLYSTAWMLASAMCLQASTKPTIGRKQAGVKNSIYVLLAGLIGSMMLAK